MNQSGKTFFLGTLLVAAVILSCGQKEESPVELNGVTRPKCTGEFLDLHKKVNDSTVPATRARVEKRFKLIHENAHRACEKFFARFPDTTCVGPRANSKSLVVMSSKELKKQCEEVGKKVEYLRANN